MMSLIKGRAVAWLSRLTRGAGYLGLGCTMLACANATTALPEALTTEGGAPPSQSSANEGGVGAEPATSGDESPDWCGVRELVRSKCQRCHGDPPEHGAPFALLHYGDLLVEDKNGTPRFVKVQRAVENDLMPATFVALEPPVEALSTDEKSLLLEWLAEMPPRQGACE